MPRVSTADPFWNRGLKKGGRASPFLPSARRPRKGSNEYCKVIVEDEAGRNEGGEDFRKEGEMRKRGEERLNCLLSHFYEL